MCDKEEKPCKRVHFTSLDVQLLISCVKKHSDVLGNKATSIITPDIKRKVNILILWIASLVKIYFMYKAWNEVFIEYNAGQSGGPKSLKSLQDKYKNEKKLAKQRLSQNKSEMRKTGGGTFEMDCTEDFGFSQEQISGLTNKFDSDFITVEENEKEALKSFGFEGIIDVDKENQLRAETPKRTMTQTAQMKYSNKKMRMSGVKDNFYELKVVGIELDNDYKRRLIEKIELEKEKIIMEKEKLQLEIKELKAKLDI